MGSALRWLTGILCVIALAYLGARWADFAPGDGIRRAEGLALLASAAFLAWRSRRLHLRARALSHEPPLTLEDAAKSMPVGSSLEGVFRGRLGATELVTSPGGVVGAFYEAHIRSLNNDALLSSETDCSPNVYLRGEHVEAKLDVEPESVLAHESARPVRAGGNPSLTESSLADGEPPVDAVSFEKVAKLGEPCLVLGTLVAGEGRKLALHAGLSGPPMILVADEPRTLARRIAFKAALLGASAAVMCIASASVLAR